VIDQSNRNYLFRWICEGGSQSLGGCLTCAAGADTLVQEL